MKNATSKKSRRLGRGAKIAGVIVALTLAVVTILAIALPGAATFNETAYNSMPTWLPGGGVIGSATPIVNFDDVTASGIAIDSGSTIDAGNASQMVWPADSGNNMHYVTYQNVTVNTNSFNGVKFKSDGSVYYDVPKIGGQATTTLTTAVTYDADFDGFMFYYDASDATSYTLKDNGTTVKDKDGRNCTYSYVDLNLTFTINGNLVRPQPNVNLNAYYCADGNGSWVGIKGVTGSRMQIPAGTKGWIYIPADNYYVYYDNFASAKHISELDGKTITKVQFYAGGYCVPGNTLYFDSVYAIKRNEAANLPTTAPNGALGNLTNFGFDIAEGFSDYTEIDSTGNGNSATNTRANGVFKLQYNYALGSEEAAGDAELACERGEAKITYRKNNNNINGGESVLKFDKGTDGVMFYVDASNVTSANTKRGGKIAFEICLVDGRYGNNYREIGGGWMRSSGGKGYAYDVNSKEWIEANAIDAGRMAVPVGFNGYIYIPFDQYKDDRGNVLSDIVENYNVYFPEIRLFTSGVNVEESVEPYVIFDNIGGVKFHDTYAKSAAPTTLPNGQGIAANPVAVFDFESAVYGNTSNGAFANVQLRSNLNVSAYGNNNKALVFSDLRATNPEQTIYRASGDTVSASGAMGLMYYLNLTDLKGAQSAFYNEYTGIADGTSETSFLAFGLRIFSEKGNHNCDNNVAYYYTDGQWYKTNAVNGNRILFPEGFEGYVYVPFTSYDNSLSAATQIKGVFPLTVGVVNNQDINAVNEIILDDVQFVTATGNAASNANSIPAMPQYIFNGENLSEFTTTNLINFEDNQSIYNASAGFAADFQSWKGLDMILKTNAAKNDTELVLDLSTNSGQGKVAFKSQPTIKTNSAMVGSGIIFHLDVSGMESTYDKSANVTYVYDGIGYSVKNGVGIGLNLVASDNKTYSTGSWAADRSIGYGVDHVPVFYSADGAEYWQVTTNTNNSRFVVPEDFSGWVYIPWTSLTRHDNTGDVAITSTTNASLTIKEILFYTGQNNPVKNEAAQFVLDDFSTVNFTTARQVYDEYDEEVVGEEAGYIAEVTAMRPGANIRIGANGTGMRFFTDVAKDGYYSTYFPTDYLTDYENSPIRFGTLVVPADLASGNLTRSNPNVMDIPVEKVYSEAGDKMTYTAIIQNIPFSWYNENITAVSYVVYGNGYNPDGTVKGTYIYTNSVTQSYIGFANGVLADEEASAEAKAIATKIKAVPTTLPGGSAISAFRSLTDMSSNYSFHKLNGTKGKVEFVENDPVLGTMFRVYDGDQDNGTQLEIAQFQFKRGVDATGYSGLLYYVDFSNADAKKVVGGKNYYELAIPLGRWNNVTLNGGETESRSSVNATTSGAAYYYKDGAWEPTNAASGYRMLIPEHFVGYVYVPFTSYAKWDNTAKKFIDNTDYPDDTTKNMNYIGAFKTYCNSVDQEDEVFYDNFYIVK